MKKIILLFLMGTVLHVSAQLGINTTTPQSVLDVNGDINLRDKLVILNTTSGNLLQGSNDQVLVSQGQGLPPIWKTLRIPEYEPNKFYLIYNNSFSDAAGITFASNENSTITSRAASFTKGTNYNTLNGFKKIPGLSKDFNVYSSQSKTYFQFETVVQSNLPTNNNAADIAIDYACGIFVDDQLVNLRQGNIKASNASNPFLTHNQIGIMDNLTAGMHTVSVGCSRLRSYNVGTNNYTLGIGINVATNIDSYISQSSLKVDVYEVPQVFNSIIN